MIGYLIQVIRLKPHSRIYIINKLDNLNISALSAIYNIEPTVGKRLESAGNFITVSILIIKSRKMINSLPNRHHIVFYINAVSTLVGESN